jgi:ribokinase
MMNRIDMGSPDALHLTHALEKLRARDGLTYARLLSGQNGDAAALLRLGAVRRYAAVHDIDPPQAAVEVIKECVRENLHGSERIVADAILGLGTFAEAYAKHRIHPRVVDALSSDLLGKRRTALLNNWRQLHEALGLRPVEAPSDRALRGGVEPSMLQSLARQLIRRDEYSFGSKNAPIALASDDPSHDHLMPPSGKVIVIGGAVMDAVFRTKVLPAVATSTEALSFRLAPGGKGLSQAVAAARLGLDVALVAAIARDRFADEIVNYLADEGVDTSLLKWVDGARTPFTGVVEFELGDSIAVNWPNRSEVRLDARDLDALTQRFSSCDALLLTFEIPQETLEHALTLANQSDMGMPMVIVTPGQPYDTVISGQALSQIDYLVAHEWELGVYKPPDSPSFDLDTAARRLLTFGVETICVPSSGGCNVYSESLGTFPVPTFPSQYKESETARDVFCAALTARLIDNKRNFTEDVALWATAAMGAAMADHPLPNPLPDRRRVQQVLERQRFTVNPRSNQISDATNEFRSEEPIPSPR